MRDRVSLADVARMAGVSTATVSRALNNVHGVAPDTRRRVVEAAARLGYRSSPEVSRLASRRRGWSTARRVVIVTATHEWRWWVGASAAHGRLRDAGHDVALVPVAGEDSRRATLDRLVQGRSVDAAILHGVRLDPVERELLERAGLVVVAVGASSHGGTDVVANESECRVLALEHLRERGHRRIAWLRLAGPGRLPPGGTEETSPSAGDDVLVVDVLPDGEGLRATIAALVAAREPPTALWVDPAELAVAAVAWLCHQGQRVPRDIAVIGFGDPVLAELTDLTTVSTRPVDLGTAAATLLLGRWSGDPPTSPVHVRPRLVRRGSVDQPQDSGGRAPPRRDDSRTPADEQ